jgi:fluoride ion exporter CrcB/FEX
MSLPELRFSLRGVADLLVGMSLFKDARAGTFVVRLVGACVLGVSCISWVSHVDHCNWDM